uniref:Uncharacterized protein n=1 Tax=Arundo donax TaxID=35708 RepID=A0A0A9CUF8_ARUDO
MNLLTAEYSWTKSSICTSLLNFEMKAKAWPQGFSITFQALQVHVFSSKLTPCLMMDTVTSAIPASHIKTSWSLMILLLAFKALMIAGIILPSMLLPILPLKMNLLMIICLVLSCMPTIC